MLEKAPDSTFIETHKIDFHDYWDEVNKVIADAAKQYFETFYEFEYGPGKDMTPEKQLDLRNKQYFCYLDYFNFVDYHIITFNTICNPYFGLDVYEGYIVDIPPLPEGNVYITGEQINYVTIKLYEYINKKYKELINSKNPENKVKSFRFEKNGALNGNILLYDGKNDNDINILKIPFIVRIEGNSWNIFHDKEMSFGPDNYPKIPLEKGDYLLIYNNGHIEVINGAEGDITYNNLTDNIFGKLIITD